MAFLARLLVSLPLLIVSPLIMAISAVAMALADLLWWMLGRSQAAEPSASASGAATIVIPNWNGRDFLAKYLPHLETALSHNPFHEILVVDNGSTDGRVSYLQQN